VDVGYLSQPRPTFLVESFPWVRSVNMSALHGPPLAPNYQVVMASQGIPIEVVQLPPDPQHPGTRGLELRRPGLCARAYQDWCHTRILDQIQKLIAYVPRNIFIPPIQTKVFTDYQMSQIKYIYNINNIFQETK
jgi:hypothetical protein